MLVLILIFFSPAHQGYYYTFLSLALAQQFLEMGFGVVLTQFASHESALLRLDARGVPTGSQVAAERLGSLVRLGLRWYTGVALMVLIVVGVGGSILLASRPNEGVDWNVPWWLLCATQACAVLLIPVSSLLEGSGQVAANQRNLLLGTVLGTLAGATAIIAGLGLYSIVVLVVTRTVVAGYGLVHAAWPLLRLGWTQKAGGVSWPRQFWPQQWRIALSWTSGYFMFQSFAPIAFYVKGPEVAGQVGVLVQVFVAVNQLASAWLTAAQPQMGAFAALGDLRGLGELAARTTRTSVLTAALIGASVFVLVAWIQPRTASASRLGDLVSLGLFVATAVVLQISNVESAAIRFRKREPFVGLSLMVAALIVVANVLLGGSYGVRGMAIGFCLITVLLTVPMVHRIYAHHIATA
jgi:hypothetical protein